MKRWKHVVFLCGLICAITVLRATGAPLPTQLPTRVVSWNAHSLQFIDAPTFALLPLPGTVTYRAVISQNGKSFTVPSSSPQVSLSEIWPKLEFHTFDLSFQWIGPHGNVIASDPATSRVKAPDFSGFDGKAADWQAAAQKDAAFLIRAGDEGRAPFRQPGVPTWIWSANTQDPSAPNGADVGYPCLFIPMMIDGMLAANRDGNPQGVRAMAQARAAADWALHNRLPDQGALPLFPYSTISHGHFSGGIEGQSVNLLRASWFAVGLLDLYAADRSSNTAYLDYARHIARTTMKFQAPDGSFPYRLNPQTGAVIEPYTPSAIEFVRLVDALVPFGVDDNLLKAQQRALQWMTSYVVATHHWQACFEDIAPWPPYANLSQFEAQMTIAVLCRHRRENPNYLPMAEALDRWIEDQFVVFGPSSEAADHPVQGPLVFEQFAYWFPMEVHTGLWINSLLDLHAATGKTIYLDKAKAAANAICAQQSDDGSFPTMSARRFPDGKLVGPNPAVWYNCNAIAVQALYRLSDYCKAPP